MSAILRFFGPLRLAAAAFFKHDLALRKGEHGVHIVLEERPTEAKPRKLSRAEASNHKEREDLALMLQQLAALLDELPETRHTMRHLVFVEQALAKKGLKALHKLPVDVLQRALDQIEGLVTNWSPVGLASLRSKMAVAIIDREHMDPDAEADAYRTAAVLDADPHVAAVPEVHDRSDDEALAAAYAALGHMAPAAEVELQGELGSRSARAVAAPVPRHSEHLGNIQLRELQT
ncbi:MAG: hypothetical protein KA141_00035 [Rubrivivax sp.]|jgi:hypothetical protein|nr:hypothetical protein [Rubrivivax sp.]